MIEWGKIVCDVLQALYGQEPPWIHRDLKPDQIILLPDARTIRWIDFGMAREADAPGTQPDTTRVCTDGYSAPEQTAGQALPRSDLFCLAATLYQLATGHVPEGTATVAELADALASPACPYPSDQRWFMNCCALIWPRTFTIAISHARTSRLTWSGDISRG